jgi:hypothetical protein
VNKLGPNFSLARYNEMNFPRRNRLAEETVATTASSKVLWKAENLGSGTFVISKPQRKDAKVRQAKIKNRRRGSRKG